MNILKVQSTHPCTSCEVGSCQSIPVSIWCVLELHWVVLSWVNVKVVPVEIMHENYIMQCSESMCTTRGKRKRFMNTYGTWSYPW